MADQPDADRTETLIAYVRGRLPAEEAERLRREAEEAPSLAAEIAVLRGVAVAVDAEGREATPGELGWARLSRALDGETQGRQRQSRRPLWQLAAAAGVAVVLWQVVAVPLLGPEEQGYQPVAGQPGAAFGAQVAFDPDATEGEIRALLREIGAGVSGGPSAIGLWRLGFADADAREAGIERLRAAAIVESVQAE
jgi:anti-sigma-K factor RskA